MNYPQAVLKELVERELSFVCDEIVRAEMQLKRFPEAGFAQDLLDIRMERKIELTRALRFLEVGTY